MGQQGSLGCVCSPVGSCPAMVRANLHGNAYIFGAICPARGIGSAILTHAASSGCMKLHLAEIGTRVAQASLAVVICDGAGRHQRAKALKNPPNIRLLTLPPYSLKLNPWEYLRQSKPSAWVGDGYAAILDASTAAWNWLTSNPARIRSIGTRALATVNVRSE